MLHIYYADALTDKERFIFDHIDPREKTILLVPDQFSLQAERDALRYCGLQGKAAGCAEAESVATEAAEEMSGQGVSREANQADREANPADRQANPADREANQADRQANQADRQVNPADREGAGVFRPRALLELMVTDFSALGHKVVKETEGHEPEIIDKYGRHMLLSVLLDRMDEELTVFRSRSGRRSASALADQMNTMISEMKRYEIDPDRLSEAIGQLKGGAEKAGAPAGADSFLILKLEDTLRIYRAYEEAIAGVYRDAEDYISYYADRIPRSGLIRDSQVWIYGFDTFTPKNLRVISRLLETAEDVSVVLTYEEDQPETAALPADGGLSDTARIRSLTQAGGEGLFRLTRQVMANLEDAAADAGSECRRQRILGYPRRTIWNGAGGSMQAASGADGGVQQEKPGGGLPEGFADRICLVQTSGPYEEAESAAAFIQELVRDRGWRYGDIAVLCNDMDGRGRQLLRAFERWDIPAFADQKRRALHQPVVSFLLSFLEVLTEGTGGSGIMGMIKSGLLGWSMEEETLLENYIREFRIRGSRWDRPFIWDGDRYSGEEMERLNEMRRFLVSVCQRARDAIGRRNTAGEKVRGLAGFLQEEFRIQERISRMVADQQALGLLEGAAETAQIWNAICGIFDQIVRIIGEQKVSNVLLRDMITDGLGELELGLVPASRDCVLVGTLQRSRPGRIRGLVVTGANAGLLPLDVTEEGLLSRREREQLEALELAFAGKQRITQLEEQLAIYRMFSLPEECLYVSCSQSGEDGSMLRSSEIFLRLQDWQPQVRGNLTERNALDALGSSRAAVPYLAEALRQTDGQQMMERDVWSQVLDWYRRNDPDQANRILRGLRFDNRMEALGDEMADALYRGDRTALNVSASRLEKYSGCPFAHFIQYGLRAQEDRLFEVGGREIGDVYHRCMMEFSRELEAASRAGDSAGQADNAGNTGSTDSAGQADNTGNTGRTDSAGQADNADNTDRTDSAGNTGRTDSAGTTGKTDSAGRADSAGTIGRPTWQTITEEACRARVAAILRGSAADYREGLFASDAGSQFRMDRITEICGDIAWSMVQQVRHGRIRRMFFEAPFGSMAAGMELPAIEVAVGDRLVRIRGTIDRLDVLETGDGGPAAVRIVDYKTGSNTIRPDDFAAGYRLQLMVYMDAALRAGAAGADTAGATGSCPADAAGLCPADATGLCPADATGSCPAGATGSAGAGQDDGLRPAGVFYFKIRDFRIDGDRDGIPDPADPGDLKGRMEKFYRMEGLVINDRALIGAMDERLDASDKAESTVVPVKYDPKKEAYVRASGGTLMEEEEFRQLLEATRCQVERICGEICRGEIAPIPKRETGTDREGNRITACRYCSFRSICGFDPAIRGCRYEDI